MDNKNTLNSSQLNIVNKEVCVLLADRNGIIVSINEKFSEVSGYSLAEVIGQPHSMLLHPEIIEAVIDEILETISNGKKWEGYLKKLSKAGESFWVHSTISPMESTGGFLSSCRKALDEEITEIAALYKIAL